VAPGTGIPAVTAAPARRLARLVGQPVTGVSAHQHRVFVETPDDGFTLWPLAAREGCCHVNVAVTA
jgi:hypothetical protein